ncbi:vitamin K-dependent gamma-carboxylase-like protein [Tenacibaculum adriaticum]|uniref:Vitamin K-dependent gamma-carboxylase-like protein n=1 Tax=Tenacibaculum adriaticum TaxID=413713 RepID=A0A5S5DSC2_9FLAO|nr:HTTM domain-containing protein [Tenacibaculum adriaticum]TYP98787.1 vitamin K-dependent gamma-carboxylase-like protein [Tenacibaculum adriaticum]
MLIKNYLSQQVNSASLAVFRVLFGIMMFLSIVRFWYNGWVEKLYIQPKFFFSYYGFEWVKPLGIYTYLLFIFCGLSALFVAFGFKYRFAIIAFFLSFTYIELMDKTTYLNHYYFISILSFVLIFLPANARISVDAFIRKKEYVSIPKWTVDSIKVLLGIVYFYAGLAKLNSDWLFRAMPLKIWLPSKYDLPLIGNSFMHQEWFHFVMSWGGAIYDLTIPFLLLYKRTRLLAFVLVMFFHVFTRVLFPIGMFPFIMIVSTLIFFETSFHERIINWVKKVFSVSTDKLQQVQNYQYKNRLSVGVITVFLFIQILFPWRYLLYPGELFWTEEGYRFSWRVMLMEKAGYSNFKIVDDVTKESFYVNNADYLSSFQEKQMSSQPDFILEYAHFLGDHYTNKGYKNIEVYTDSYVALNGRLSSRFIDSNVDLYQQRESFKHKDWILPFTDEIKIKGL